MYQRFIERLIKGLELRETHGQVEVDKKEEVANFMLTLIEGFGYFRTTMGEQHPHIGEGALFFKQKFVEVMNANLRDNPQNKI